ncbi:SMI1/KNR4 family protein [Paenibacillus sp. PastM-2]|uniref:SMI1/KNR4 family protein n=1 Tax=unclassified Paenibacillus TaxID=185978 RepID=UPI003216B72B
MFIGDFSWSIKSIVAAEEERKGWEQQVFSDLDDEYDRVWHNMLGFMAVGNGDFVAFDLSVPADPPVVYLSHDGGDGHGYSLGDNFMDFMDRWSKIGCVGCEDWQLIPFMDSPVSGILPDSDNAKLWRSWPKVEL